MVCRGANEEGTRSRNILEETSEEESDEMTGRSHLIKWAEY
jgi:hypothetical protein